jgi:hypothetical protein
MIERLKTAYLRGQRRGDGRRGGREELSAAITIAHTAQQYGATSVSKRNSPHFTGK